MPRVRNSSAPVAAGSYHRPPTQRHPPAVHSPDQWKERKRTCNDCAQLLPPGSGGSTGPGAHLRRLRGRGPVGQVQHRGARFVSQHRDAAQMPPLLPHGVGSSSSNCLECSIVAYISLSMRAHQILWENDKKKYTSVLRIFERHPECYRQFPLKLLEYKFIHRPFF